MINWEENMPKIRCSLSSMWGYKKNTKTGNGWVIVEDNGDIFVKNAFKSDPLGNVEGIINPQIDGKKISFKNNSGDNIILHIAGGSEKAFYSIITTKALNKSQIGSSESEFEILIKKLADLRDEGLLSEEEFLAKKTEILKRI